MGTRGRKSSASLSAASAATVIQRPDAPYDLTDEQAEEWWAVVKSKPADFFGRETHALLSAYCRHVVEARRIAQLIAAELKSPDLNVMVYDRLLKMQEREGRAITSLATKMRISQQATVDRRTAFTRPSMRRPWEPQQLEGEAE